MKHKSPYMGERRRATSSNAFYKPPKETPVPAPGEKQVRVQEAASKATTCPGHRQQTNGSLWDSVPTGRCVKPSFDNLTPSGKQLSLCLADKFLERQCPGNLCNGEKKESSSKTVLWSPPSSLQNLLRTRNPAPGGPLFLPCLFALLSTKRVGALAEACTVSRQPQAPSAPL